MGWDGNLPASDERVAGWRPLLSRILLKAARVLGPDLVVSGSTNKKLLNTSTQTNKNWRLLLNVG